MDTPPPPPPPLPPLPGQRVPCKSLGDSISSFDINKLSKTTTHEGSEVQLLETPTISEWKIWHGFGGSKTWALPQIVASSDKAVRSDQKNFTKANEYLDTPQTLIEKMKLIAGFIRKANYCVAYTGAGLSKSSGINDYATKAENSVAQTEIKLTDYFSAQPTYAHYSLTAMEKAGILHYYIQQNHDGLPQKSGYPQTKINEIHGAWYDPSNPVVQFSEKLREDLYQDLLKTEEKTDLCLCLGTSLSGMNADRVALSAAKKSKQQKALGTIVINLQRTPLDSKSVVRVWAKLDDAFKLLMEFLGIKPDLGPCIYPLPTGDVFKIPYDEKGQKNDKLELVLDLRPKSKIVIVEPHAKNFGAVGEIDPMKKEGGHYIINLWEEKKGIRYCVERVLGLWWVYDAILGRVPRIPIVNQDAVAEIKS